MVQNGIPAKYGGFETFVEKLTAHQSNKNLKYHVACLSNGIQENFNHNDADCFNISNKNIGPANAIYYDLAALKYSLKEIIENRYEGAIIYILACRIGPFIGHYKKQMKKLGITLMVNPDGECEIIWATRQKPDFMRVYAAWPFHLNLFLPVMVRCGRFHRF